MFLGTLPTKFEGIGDQRGLRRSLPGPEISRIVDIRGGRCGRSYVVKSVRVVEMVCQSWERVNVEND